jgi:hypothetical protein
MSNERSDTSSSGRQNEADNLKLINGIGPVVEKRLYGIGIFTFAQLAALSPTDVAAAVIGISGLTSERIVKQDWIGQARKLARQSTVSEPDWIEQAHQLAAHVTVTGRIDDAELPGETQHSTKTTSEPQEETKTVVDSPHRATFTIELLLNEDNEPLRTHIVHHESGNVKNWDSWPYRELLSFFVQHAPLNLSQQGSWPSNTKEMASASPFAEGSERADALTEEIETPLPSMQESRDVVVLMEEREVVLPIAEETPLRATIASHPVGKLRVRELKVVERGTTLHRNTLPSELPFDVQLTVDLSGQGELTGSSLEYGVQFYAKRLEDRARYTLAEARITISFNEIITITAQSKTVPQGTYRLWANVTILATDKATAQSILSTAHAKGGMLLIY